MDDPKKAELKEGNHSAGTKYGIAVDGKGAYQENLQQVENSGKTKGESQAKNKNESFQMGGGGDSKLERPPCVVRQETKKAKGRDNEIKAKKRQGG